MSKIKVVEGGCWEYLPIRRRPKNYGIFHIRGVRYKAHQAAYLLWNGPLEQGMEVSHECDHSWCVNPAHLRLRTHGSNMEGMAERGRARNGPPKIGTLCNWAKLTDQQVIEIRTSTETNRVLAEKYKVHPRHIWRLKSGECWPHIKPPIDNLDFVCH